MSDSEIKPDPNSLSIEDLMRVIWTAADELVTSRGITQIMIPIDTVDKKVTEVYTMDEYEDERTISLSNGKAIYTQYRD